MEFFATCAGGLERLLADELRDLGCARVRPLRGQVVFEGALEDAYRVCLWSRLASRVVVVLARVDAQNSEQLYKSVRALDWEAQLLPGATLAVDAHGTNAELRNTRYVAQRVKDAIGDTLYAKRGARPVVDTRSPDLSVVVRITRDRALVGIDLAGELLFHRGYGGTRAGFGQLAALRADYAAALVAKAGLGAASGADEQVLVLYPGTGTLLVETASVLLDRAPGLLHERWGMRGWAGHDEATWEALRKEAERRAEEGAGRAPELLVAEPRRGGGEACAHLLRAAGLDVAPRFLALGEVPASVDRVIADLSWSAGASLPERVEPLACVAQAAQLPTSAVLAVLAPDATVDRAVGLQPSTSEAVLLGRDDLVLSRYELAEGRPVPARVTLADGSEIPVNVAASDQFAKRLAKMAHQRQKWARREDISCYRIYDSDLPDYAVTIDLYEGVILRGRSTGRWLSIYEYAPPHDVDATLAQARMLDALAIAPRVLDVAPRDVFVRTRVRARGGSQYAAEARAEAHEPRGGRPGRRTRAQDRTLPEGAHLIDEGGLTFEVNFSSRLDSGIFLDHRETRSMLREMAKHLDGNGRFLNLFAYTGTGTCYAADGGARATTTVDLSRPSLDWAQRNMARNGFDGPEHEFVQADVLAWIREQRRGRNRWDLIFCDVPTFSNSSRMRSTSFDVQRDHVELLISVSRLLTRADEASGWKGGTCVFSCNLRSFRPDERALARAGVEIEDITRQTIPQDFVRSPRIHHCFLVRRMARA